jgi:hypothetical protein
MAAEEEGRQMRLDADTEKLTRRLLGHALRGEIGELEAALSAVNDVQQQECVTLCLLITGYVVCDVCAGWPADADATNFARTVAETTDLPEGVVCEYLTRSVLHFEPIDKVFSDPDEAVMIMIRVAAELLVRFLPSQTHFWDYLDVVEAGLEIAESADMSVYPAMLWRAQRMLAQADQAGELVRFGLGPPAGSAAVAE